MKAKKAVRQMPLRNIHALLGMGSSDFMRVSITLNFGTQQRSSAAQRLLNFDRCLGSSLTGVGKPTPQGVLHSERVETALRRGDSGRLSSREVRESIGKWSLLSDRAVGHHCLVLVAISCLSRCGV